VLDMSTLGDAADVNPVIKFLPRTRAPYATCFTTAATKDRGGSRCYRMSDFAMCVAGT
jgi:hypothetical protein